ncbi:MAG: hypothetical protein EZS26_003234 [Candidatus Ordinivivax streblomastigis]|uniref:Uncharacterized protein n=1 Tax=Candidatus Ordinivivax streblomastigis TaxID=2540710 RepID=A0A5M8NWB0_9BACT|nr:MAG: hypothetical protein EZS26_003234 [Candidatus Ordinivivax streblomastigis]
MIGIKQAYIATTFVFHVLIVFMGFFYTTKILTIN